jgi:hypothetical protein
LNRFFGDAGISTSGLFLKVHFWRKADTQTETLPARISCLIASARETWPICPAAP